MCLEQFFLINLLMDFSICAAVARSTSCFRLGRLLLSSTFGACYALFVRTVPGAAAPPFQLALLLPITLLTAGPGPLTMLLAFALSLPTVALASGACAACFGITGFRMPLMGLPVLLSLAPRLRKAMLSALPTSVEVHCRGITVRFPACIDTGNRLTEPFSGQPVLIASAKLLGTIRPDSGFRQVAFGSIGGNGSLPCFRPEALYILQNGRRRRMPETWIAVYPDRLPGAFQALAPADFILY